jgi:hypothetical protein
MIVIQRRADDEPRQCSVVLTDAGISHTAVSDSQRLGGQSGAQKRHGVRLHAIETIVDEVARDVPLLGISRYRRRCTSAGLRVFWRARTK